MKIFTFFIEPATYSLDLKKNVYNDLGIDSVFIKKNRSIAKSTEEDKHKALEGNSIFFKINFVVNIFKNYDFIIINGYTSFIFLFLFLLNKISKNKRYLAIESDTPLYKPKNKFKKKLKTIFLNYIFKPSWILGFAGGSDSHKELFRYYGMAEKQIYLMPMMVDNSKYFISENNIDSNNFTFIYVGRIIDLKNIESMIKVFLALFAQNNNVKLMIVGDGELLPYLKTKYPFDNIIFTGTKSQQDLKHELANANVFVLPSKKEAWGLVVNEALSAGLPVIISDRVGSANDLVRNRGTGLIFKLDDLDTLKESMKVLYENSGLRKEYSNNAIKLMKSHWNYELYKKCLLKALQYKAN